MQKARARAKAAFLQVHKIHKNLFYLINFLYSSPRVMLIATFTLQDLASTPEGKASIDILTRLNNQLSRLNEKEEPKADTKP